MHSPHQVFTAKECEVVLAADGAAASLLASEFPGISIRTLKGYDIRYNSGSSLFGSMALQLPRIFSSIQEGTSLAERCIGKRTV
ncbi:MAG: hypothetical protein IPK31_08940 [Chitinophagaceae bacterium]|nr:hypothetical protein [Chitinophagaceae bacterium]